MTHSHQPAARSRPLPRIDARTLFAAHREIVVVFNDTEYRLRVTRNDKLILTK